MALIDKLSAIGDAIREKNGITDLIPLADMPQAILDIVSGGGGIVESTEYLSVTYNDDDTITLIDKEGTEHTMVCTYQGDKLVDVKYDGKTVRLSYKDDALNRVGNTAVDFANAKTSSGASLDHIVTFTVDGEPYEIVNVKNGNSVNAPATNPAKDSLVFIEWRDSDDKRISFPFPTTTDTQIFAHFTMVHSELEYYDAGTILGTYGRIVYDPNTSCKVYDGWSILGIQYKDGCPCAILVGLSEQACEMNDTTLNHRESYAFGSVEYKDVTYYYSTYKTGFDGNTVTATAYDTQVDNNDQEAALLLLKYYFND